ncbi:MAG TPA: NAD(P)/FAD-dependent oxidoreductase, partial [Myxococcaceae bacterium]|nr:NAD(P)/FAD-dependent oxidoreductase [Myxococcaceae bacterium]
LKDGEPVSYDYLLVATGATHSYFGRDEWSQYAMGLKRVEDALEIRRRVLTAYEAAERETDPNKVQEWLTFLIIGGGPTGVELAGALAEIAHVVADDFRRIDSKQARIVLLEGLPEILQAYPKSLAERARKALGKLGVEVRTGTRVTAVDEHGVSVGHERIGSRTMVWAAGVAASPLAKTLNVPLDRAGRVKVTPNLTVPGHDNVFVVGDLAALEQDGALVPGVAPAAMQEGKHVAKNIRLALKGQPMKPFRYWDRGTFAVIGRGAAVGIMFRKFWLWGHLAWLSWLAIHIVFLIGFRNRVAVLFNWAYSYLTFRRGARLITGEAPADRSEPRRTSLPRPTAPAEARVH